MLNSLEIRLSKHFYPIHFGETAGIELASLCERNRLEGRKSAVVTDQLVAEAVKSTVALPLFSDIPVLRLPAGEQTKSLASFGSVLDFLAEQKIDRRGVLWVVGGGVIGDLGGYAAASYLRGIDFVQVPTTLLAMVDSSVGGKTGINIAAGKNLVGAFHHPVAVFILPELLQTLPAREFAAGMAEVVKYGLLGDPSLLAQLEGETLSPRSAHLPAVIRRCCELKAAIVQADERETAAEGGRALLNLGHTFGHAIEKVAGYGTYLHGEAVAIGLVAAAKLSGRLDLISGTDVDRVARLVAANALPVRLRAPLPRAALMAAMQSDKKVRGGRLRFVVLQRLGQAVTRADVDAGPVEEVWRELGAG